LLVHTNYLPEVFEIIFTTKSKNKKIINRTKQTIMKKLFFLCSMFLLTLMTKAQNVAINNDGTSAATSAMLDVKSTTKGMLIPRMTTAQRTALTAPVLGLLVFDTDTKTVWAYDGTAWKNLYTSGGLTLPFAQSVNVATPVFQIENSGAGDVLYIGNTGSGAGLNLYSTTGTGINVNTSGNIGIRATSWNSNAIHAITDNPANTIPTIRGNNIGGGDGVYGNALANGKAGVRGVGNAANTYGVRGENNNASGAGVYGQANLGIGVQGVSQSGTGLFGGSVSGYGLIVDGNVRIAGGNTNPSAGAVLTSDANGNATWQQQTPNVAFKVSGVMANYPLIPHATYVKMQYEAEEYDLGGNFVSLSENGNTDQANAFYVPVNGIYHFNVSLGYNCSTDLSSFHIQIIRVRNGVQEFIANFLNGNPGDLGSTAGGADANLLAGDKIYIGAYQTNGTITHEPVSIFNIKYETYFSGHLVRKL
jgi:C1q domain